MEPDKSQLVINWMASGPVRVYFDATRAGVVVPQHLRYETKVCFDWGFNMPKPIRDLKIDDDAISGTLSFGKVISFCSVPWESVFVAMSLSLGKAKLWLEDAPASVRDEVLEQAGSNANARVRREKFGLIEGGKSKKESKKERP